jgi:hypothetical protein
MQRAFKKGALSSVPTQRPMVKTENDTVRSRQTRTPIVVKLGIRLSGRPRPLAAVFRLEAGLAFVRPDCLARFCGLLHLAGSDLDWDRDFM